MRVFAFREIHAAYAHSQAGGQALHLHGLHGGRAPYCQYPVLGHLLDQDLVRLIQTAQDLGLRRFMVEDEDTHRQHIDLYGDSLARVLAKVDLCGSV